MRHLLPLVILSILAIPNIAAADWVEHGILVSGMPGNEDEPALISDGASGMIVAWALSNGVDLDIYAQRLAPDGTEMWTSGGVPISTASDDQVYPRVVPDGAGGAVICWSDQRNGGIFESDVYAQRVSADGAVLWAADGVPVCTAADAQFDVSIHFDGSACVIAWQDSRSGGSPDIYVQRVGLNGSPSWAANGVGAVTLVGSIQENPVVVGDGAAGAIVSWVDHRNASNQVYVQLINFFGTPAWAAGGVAVDGGSDQWNHSMIEDGAGGVIIAYDDATPDADIYVHRRDPSGSELWTTAISTVADLQLDPSMVSDGSGGAILAWRDGRDDSGDIYAQRVTAAGVPLWEYNGTPVAALTGFQYNPQVHTDGSGGAVIVWQDNRFGDSDIYAQRVSPYGQPVWTGNGVPVSAGPGAQIFFESAGSGNGGAFAAWEDTRSAETNIYAQRIEPDYGAWGQPEPSIASVTDDPDDQGGDVALNWYASERDQFLHPEVTHYSMWRAIDAVTASAMAATGLGDISPGFKKPVIRRQSTSAGDYFWELLGTQIALRSSGYSYLAETRDDSTSTDPAVHYFQVVAHTSNANVFYVSDAVSGYSVDNLAPASPIMLVAERVGNYVRLDWMPGTEEDEPDFDTYAVYRDYGPGVAPEPLYYLSATQDTTLWDQSVDPDRPYYYIVTALDIHENESDPSNTANVGATVTGAGNPPALTSLQVRGNFPNPFGGATELQIGLPDRTDVSIDVFDVRGRRVAGVSKPAMAAGWGSVRFDGRDDSGAFLPSGVYFYRVSAGGETMTRKLVIQR